MVIVIANNLGFEKNFIDEMRARSQATVYAIERKEDLTKEFLDSIKPDWIFFTHWSYKISKEIHENFRCVIFHMTDLPFGRGGSPLQNLIQRGIYETKICALKCVDAFDAGDVYLRRPLSLWGTAREIFLRGGEIVKEMILEIMRGNITPIPQEGDPVVFKRRTPPMSNLAPIEDLKTAFDYIRMLDAEGYPQAFLETDTLRFEFSRASMHDGFILADVKIFKKEKKE